jgi:hypothetical protein
MTLNKIRTAHQGPTEPAASSNKRPLKIRSHGQFPDVDAKERENEFGKDIYDKKKSCFAFIETRIRFSYRHPLPVLVGSTIEPSYWNSVFDSGEASGKRSKHRRIVLYRRKFRFLEFITNTLASCPKKKTVLVSQNERIACPSSF